MEQTLNIFIPLVLGSIFGFIGIARIKRYRRITQNGTKTMATIIDFEVEEVDEPEFSGTFYMPIFEFKNSEGDIIKKKHNSSMPRRNLLKRVTIYYNKIDGDYEIMVDSKGWNYFFSLIIISISIVLLVVSLISIIKS